eukprot:5297017-Pyramimonas_sp.AAC.1
MVLTSVSTWICDTASTCSALSTAPAEGGKSVGEEGEFTVGEGDFTCRRGGQGGAGGFALLTDGFTFAYGELTLQPRMHQLQPA